VTWLFICISRLIRMCAMTHSYETLLTCDMRLMRVMWLVRMCDTTRCYTWLCLFGSVTLLVCVCHVTLRHESCHTHQWSIHRTHMNESWRYLYVCDMTRSYVYHGSIIDVCDMTHASVEWRVRMCDMIHPWPIRLCDMTHSSVEHTPLICVTHTPQTHTPHLRDIHDPFTWVIRPVNVCDMQRSYVRYDSFICMTHSYIWRDSLLMWIYACVSICVFVYQYVCVSVCVFVYKSVRVCACQYILMVWVYMCVSACVFVYICVCACVSMCEYICV